MNSGHAIGSATVPITTVALGNTARTGRHPRAKPRWHRRINGSRLTAGGAAGSLILTGTRNSYSGGTTVNTTLQVGTATQAGSLPVGTVANNGALRPSPAPATSLAITTLTGGGSYRHQRRLRQRRKCLRFSPEPSPSTPAATSPAPPPSPPSLSLAATSPPAPASPTSPAS